MVSASTFSVVRSMAGESELSDWADGAGVAHADDGKLVAINARATVPAMSRCHVLIGCMDTKLPSVSCNNRQLDHVRLLWLFDDQHASAYGLVFLSVRPETIFRYNFKYT